jgi:hypothetical protein
MTILTSAPPDASRGFALSDLFGAFEGPDESVFERPDEE